MEDVWSGVLVVVVWKRQGLYIVDVLRATREECFVPVLGLELVLPLASHVAEEELGSYPQNSFFSTAE